MYRDLPDITRMGSEAQDSLESSIRVRLGIEEADHGLHEITGRSFSIALSSPLPIGTRLFVAFRLPDVGLSISMEAAAGPWERNTGVQRFTFVEPAQELVNLLLLSSDTPAVH